MSRSIRHALIATLVALHAAVTLGGAGLHALPGLGHDSGLRPFAKNDHSHGPGRSSHEAADDCSVCQFLAQGQDSPDRVNCLVSWVSVGLAVFNTPAADTVTPRGPSSPRAPPSLPACSA